MANGIVRLLEPIGKSFQENEDWQRIAQLAYPDPNANVEKKKKKVRSRFFYFNVFVFVSGDNDLVPFIGESIPSTSSGKGQKRETS